MINVLKSFLFFVIGISLISTLAYSQDDPSVKKDEPVGIKMADGILYGKDYEQTMTVIEFSDLMKAASDYDGKVVLVKGNVAEVCQEMGCWMIMSDGTNNVRVKTLHEFFLPKDISGRSAVVIGTFKSTEISEEMAKHYNEESTKPGIKTEDLKGPQKVFEIDATGIKILNAE